MRTLIYIHLLDAPNVDVCPKAGVAPNPPLCVFVCAPNAGGAVDAGVLNEKLPPPKAAKEKQ